MALYGSPEALNEQDMVGLMAAIGPFEDKPHIAVAVSGGADSLALTLLADAWVRSKGGRVTALSVDHGLRAESATETAQVASWLGARGIEHQVLRWTGEKPAAGLQAAARDARYRIMADWCRRAGVLHLLLGHHLEDQAETFLLRLKHDSGIDGLAAMAAIVEKPDMRLLRPLLGVAKAQLRATLEAADQQWLEDPSNENPAFERVRIRKSLPDLAALGITVQGLSQTAGRMARARVALEGQVSELLGQCCALDRAGYARINGTALFSSPDEISLRAVSRTLMCIGGGEYPPRLLKLERLHNKMKAAQTEDAVTWKGATLGRCRILALRDANGALQFLVCREERFLPPAQPVARAMEIDWDHRFRLRLRGRKNIQYQDIRLLPLGGDGWSRLLKQAPEIAACAVPAAVRPTLPTLIDDAGILAVPHLGYHRVGLEADAPGFSRADFHPRQSLSGTGFLVAE